MVDGSPSGLNMTGRLRICASSPPVARRSQTLIRRFGFVEPRLVACRARPNAMMRFSHPVATVSHRDALISPLMYGPDSDRGTVGAWSALDLVISLRALIARASHRRISGAHDIS
jgi:hypothetical protein